MQLIFVTPPLNGPATGGTLYNQQLLAAMTRLQVRWQQHQLPALPATLGAEQVWVDSLYLQALPELRSRLPGRARLCLLLHYLPSLLDQPRLRRADQLTASERAALQHADLIVTPSAFLRELVMALSPGKPCVCVAPGVAVDRVGGERTREAGAMMVCNVTPNKQVLPFLYALVEAATPADAFVFTVAGSLTLDAAYAQRCLQARAQNPWLRRHVQFVGTLAQPPLFERLARAGVFVSASAMESYGMALAEARALGTPILATPGGNVVQHVAANSGGELLPDCRSLARALTSLMRDRDELLCRQQLARASAEARDWEQVAREFVRVTEQFA